MIPEKLELELKVRRKDIQRQAENPLGSDVVKIRLMALQRWLPMLRLHELEDHSVQLYILRAEKTRATDYLYNCSAEPGKYLLWED